jgi:hypothetical protein
MGLYYIYMGLAIVMIMIRKIKIMIHILYIYIMSIIKRLKGSVICINKYVYNINNMFQPVQF